MSLSRRGSRGLNSTTQHSPAGSRSTLRRQLPSNSRTGEEADSAGATTPLARTDLPQSLGDGMPGPRVSTPRCECARHGLRHTLGLSFGDLCRRLGQRVDLLAVAKPVEEGQRYSHGLIAGKRV